MITKELIEMYHKFRKHKPFMLSGRDAECSLSSARTILRFRELESEDLVRMRAEPEEESYLDVYGDDELRHAERNGHPIPYDQARKELIEMLDRDGVWWTVAEWRASEDDEWEQADSCGMHAGYKDVLDPFQNCYVIDEMQSAIDALEKHLDDQKSEAFESTDAACRDIVTV
jgi:hypothetical protein